jgi:signal transduction histidine kinase
VIVALAAGAMTLVAERARARAELRLERDNATAATLLEVLQAHPLPLPVRAAGVTLLAAAPGEVLRGDDATTDAARAGGLLRLPTKVGSLSSDIRLPVWQLQDGRLVYAAVDGQRALPRDPPFPWAALLVAAIVASTAAWLATRGVDRSLRAIREAADGVDTLRSATALVETGPPEQRAVLRALNAMQRRIGEQIDARVDLLSAISHDLKTPLAKLMYRVEAVEPPELRRALATDIEDMRRMVDAAVEYMRTLDDRERPSPLDLQSTLQALVDDQQEEGHDVQLRATLKEPIIARPVALRRALGNLVDNAVKHGGSAWIEATQDDRELRIRIVDQGAGVSEEELARLAQPYYRGQRARLSGIPGHGLGLSIARNVVEGHGGTLAFRNAAQGGFEVWVTLPMTPRQELGSERL